MPLYGAGLSAVRLNTEPFTRHTLTLQLITNNLGPQIYPSRTNSLNPGSVTYRRDSSWTTFCSNMLLTVL